jgi:hypothetical protein
VAPGAGGGRVAGSRVGASGARRLPPRPTNARRSVQAVRVARDPRVEQQPVRPHRGALVGRALAAAEQQRAQAVARLGLDEELGEGRVAGVLGRAGEDHLGVARQRQRAAAGRRRW